MASRTFYRDQASLTPARVELDGVVTLGASGAVSSQKCYGFTVAKTASEVGRYTVTLEDSYPELVSCTVTVEGAADAAYTAGRGLVTFVRNVNVASKTLDIQVCRVNGVTDYTDTEPADSSKLYIALTLKNTSLNR